MCSAIDEVIAVDRVAMRDGNKFLVLRDILKLIRQIRRAKYELVIDFHGFRETSLLAWWSRANWRLGLKRAHGAYLPFCFNLEPIVEDKTKHVADVFSSLRASLGIDSSDEDITLDLSADDLAKADSFLLRRGVARQALILGFNVGAGSSGRMWPQRNFADLARRMIHQWGTTVIFFSGPQDGDFSNEIADLTHDSRALTAKNLSLRTLAALISRCKLFVSNDTGPMHLGPATGVPTLGLFSLGYPEHYRPLGTHSRFVQKHPIEDLQVGEVYEIVREMMEMNH
jgi:ADP-heptose:LPS heptosyltransferase